MIRKMSKEEFLGICVESVLEQGLSPERAFMPLYISAKVVEELYGEDAPRGKTRILSLYEIDKAFDKVRKELIDNTMLKAGKESY